jgi:hypothetical protein
MHSVFWKKGMGKNLNHEISRMITNGEIFASFAEEVLDCRLENVVWVAVVRVDHMQEVADEVGGGDVVAGGRLGLEVGVRPMDDFSTCG